jgi:hypothetical protein
MAHLYLNEREEMGQLLADNPDVGLNRDFLRTHVQSEKAAIPDLRIHRF